MFRLHIARLRSWCLAALAGLLFSNSLVACLVCIVPYQSLLDKVESADHVFVGRAVDASQTQWQVVSVITGDDLQRDQVISINRSKSENVTPGELQVLRYHDLSGTFLIESPVDAQLQKFLAESLALWKALPKEPSLRDQSGYFQYFLPYLEHSHPAIADSAYNKLAAAPYAVLRIIGTEAKPEQLREWINDPAIVKDRGTLYITMLGICGGEIERAQLKQWIDERLTNGSSSHLAAMLTAHAELNGESALTFMEETYFRGQQRTLGELIAASQALRLHGQADDKIPRRQILAVYQRLLKERPQLLELFLDDCMHWQDWTIAPQLIQLYLDGKQPWHNKLITDYLQACPLPAAKKFLATIGVAKEQLAESAAGK